MVPNGWEEKTLEDITKEKISYGIVQAGPHIDDGVPYLKSSDVGGEISISSLQRTAHDIHEKYKRSAVHPNDIVFSLRGNIGRTSIVPGNLPEANLTQGTARISVNDKNDTKFVYYSLATSWTLNRINSLSKGSTFKEISLAELRKVKLLFPSLHEQRKIAKILTTWDKVIDTTERLIDNSKQQKKALMQQLLTGKKRLLDDNGKPFEGEWEEVKISDVFDVGSSKRVLQEDWQESGIPFYRTRELVSLAKKEPFSSSIFISEQLYKELIDKYGMPSEGDFLVSGVGTLGIIYQVKKGDEFYFKDGNVLWFKKKGEISSDFFKYSFLADYVQHQIDLQSSVTTVGTYTIKNARLTKFLCPSLKEQQKIAAVLTNADKEINLLEQQLTDLQQEKKALMQVLLTGKKRVKLND